MKKTLLAMPLLAALLLVGCGKEESESAKHVHVAGTKWYSNETIHWHKCVADGCDAKSKKLDSAEHDFVEDETKHINPSVDEAGYAYYECSVCGYHYEEEIPQLADKRGPATVGDYVRVDNPVEGEKYFFGFYKPSTNKLMLANGKYHSDSKGSYPFYMATVETDAETTEAASFEISKLSGGTEFTIKVTCPNDTTRPWHNKYMSIYSASSSYDNAVMSLAAVDNINEKFDTLDTSAVPKPTGNLVDVNGKFEFVTTTETAVFNGVGIVAKHSSEDNERLWTFGCKYTDYVSIDCSNEDKALSNDYSVAHFYKLAD